MKAVSMITHESQPGKSYGARGEGRNEFALFPALMPLLLSNGGAAGQMLPLAPNSSPGERNLSDC